VAVGPTNRRYGRQYKDIKMGFLFYIFDAYVGMAMVLTEVTGKIPYISQTLSWKFIIRNN
jgi:hypothetical protein